VWVGFAVVLATAVAGCESRRTVIDTLVEYAAAVQAEDFDRLYCLSAGAASAEELGADAAARRTAFNEWARAHFDAYLQGRDEGFVPLDGHGIELVKLFALGAGTFQDFGPARSAGADARRVSGTLRFGYGQIDLSRFVPGTTIYLAGVPVGTIEPVVVPFAGGEVSAEVLETVSVEWTVVRSAKVGDCAAGWTVASVEPVAGSERSTELTWVF